jgi:hypothetical protein
MIDCSSMGRSCIPGLGCGVCTPGMRQCKIGDPNTTQECASDGSGWVDGATCNTAAGESCQGGVCRGACSELGSSYLGCEYWPTITTNSVLDNGFFFSAVVANPGTRDVNVRVEGGALTSPRERVIRAGAVEAINLPWVPQLSNNDPRMCPPDGCRGRSARVPGGAFHLTSNGPVAVYQFNPLQFAKVMNASRQSDFSFSNDASLLMPQNVLARQYIVVAPPNENFGTAARPVWAGAFVAIVGAQAEGTNNVSVRLTAAVQDPANPARTIGPGEVMLQVERGEVVQLVGANAAGDLTGTLVNAAGPVAVFAGHDCARIPTSNPACDHVEEQLFPTTTWGRTYAVTPFRDRPTQANHQIRIVAQRDGVMLTFDGIPAPADCNRMLNQGESCRFETQTPFQVTGSQPIMVAQFMRGLGDILACRCNTATGTCPMSPMCVGDPAMVLEVPTDQYRSNYNFLIPDSYQQNYINVTASRGAMIMLDGNMLMATPTPVGANLVMYHLSIMPGQHSIRAMTDLERFGLKVYGVASFTSYAFPGGLDLAPISPPG